ncbi:hypothetical protein [Nocardia wallacei]|uniref:hypothetical protein n=1 Tax=Nocardia wallacei TaxID=480035 RepID=UPI0024579FA3|nr:hypothetical protein [Nocardia wallacei]
MSGWASLGLFLGVLALSVIVFCAIVYWPQRAPKDRSVDAIRKRIEEEGDE